MYGIEKISTTAYRTSTNGATERLHRTLNSMLGKVVIKSHLNWDTKVQRVMAAYRATFHEVTRYSYNFLIFVRERRESIDSVLEGLEDTKCSNPDEFVDAIRLGEKEAYALACAHLERQAERNKHSYDMRARPPKLEVGNWVCLYSNISQLLHL